ncbi:MAG: RluA family pseudouridine synthase [Parachlamydiales bacterium]|jgi:23S rRNA pseudouridine1911/1915/1917 synthase
MTLDQNNFLITLEDELVRIDKLLAKKFESKSRTYFQFLLENGSILVNGQRVKKRFTPAVGDEIEIFFQALEDSSINPENIPLDILYEDEHILAINKPKNMVVHPAIGNWSNTFVNALLYHCKDLVCIGDDIRPGIVHRLDKDTTGVLLAAKTQRAHQILIDQFKLRQIQKKYLALTVNKPQNQVINAPIGRNPINRKEMAVIENGKEAVTEIKVLAFNDKYSLILALPKTGRTHQIRVHLKHINCPIIGDPIYGSKSINNTLDIQTPQLHAYILEFSHPITKEPMKITAPLSDELKKNLNLIE